MDLIWESGRGFLGDNEDNAQKFRASSCRTKVVKRGASASLKGLLKLRVLDPTPRVSDSVPLGRGSRICIFKKFLGDTEAAVVGTTL